MGELLKRGEAEEEVGVQTEEVGTRDFFFAVAINQNRCGTREGQR